MEQHGIKYCNYITQQEYYNMHTIPKHVTIQENNAFVILAIRKSTTTIPKHVKCQYHSSVPSKRFKLLFFFFVFCSC